MNDSVDEDLLPLVPDKDREVITDAYRIRQELMRPLWVFQTANAQLRSLGKSVPESMRNSALTRRRNAAREIREIVDRNASGNVR